MGKSNETVYMWVVVQGFFSKFLMGGLKIFGPHRSPTPDGDEVGWGGGGTCENNPD